MFVMEVPRTSPNFASKSQNTTKHASLDSGVGSFDELEPMEFKQRSMTTACEDLKPVEETQLQNGDDSESQRFNFVYLGVAVLDRRYTQNMLPWVISEIRRRKERQEIYLSVEGATVTALAASDGSAAFQHGVQTITRCARSLDKKCFAYLVKSSEHNCSCYCYAFEAVDSYSVPGFIHCIRETVKGSSIDQSDGKNIRKISDPVNPLSGCTSIDEQPHIMVSYPLGYVGKVVVSHRQAPPTLIDDSVDRFKNLNRRKDLEMELSGQHRQASSHSPKISKRHSPPELVKQLHRPVTKVSSLDEGKILGNSASVISEPVHFEEMQRSVRRPRSASDGDKKLLSVPPKERCDSDHLLRNTHHRAASFGANADNRSVLLQVTSQSVSVISTATNVVLLEKKLREISFCQQGTKNPDQFGFICREPRSAQYVCYVFKGDTEPLVDSVMRSLKDAFHAAWQAAGSTKVCEMCPLHHLHQLCTQLEGMSVIQQHESLKKHLLKLTDAEMNDFTDRYKADTHGTEISELSEDVDVIMTILRSLYEKRQLSHTHTSSVQVQAKDSLKTGPNILQKAKKSLTSSFENFRSKRVRSKSTLKHDNSLDYDERSSSDEMKSSPVTRRRSHTLDNLGTGPTPPLSPIGEKELEQLPQHILEAMPVHQQRMRQAHLQAQAQAKVPRNKSSDSLPDEAFGSNSSSPPQTPTKVVSQMHRRLSRQFSYRQNIFNSVVTPSKRNSMSSREGSCSSWVEVTGRKRSSQELRALWRKAIMEQILLNRMEKENQTLDDFLKSYELKCLKLSYNEGSPCSQSAVAKWEQLLARPWDMQVEKGVLKDAVKAGVPKEKRGEIWQYLAKQYSLRSPACKDAYWKAGSYEEMKDGTGLHQHSIFIDLGRTFPRHPYFMSQFGPGQLSLFNLLKAYSVLDEEVGYCQGLSFVAGILLMHMEEAGAFDVMRHLLFALDLRKLYKSDMQELQIQFYMLSRLLHDYHSPLYEFLEEHDITPTLYAAAWFLTLFASQFPVGFVVRVMDMIFLQGMDVGFKVMLSLLSRCKEGIMDCDGFECAVDYMKTELPPYAFKHMDSIVAQVLDMDITKELESYGIEYNVLREEDLSLASVEEFEHQRAKKLEDENAVLSRHLQEVSEQLSGARNTIMSLECTIHTMQINQSELLTMIRALRTENDNLKRQSGQVNARKSPSQGGGDKRAHTPLSPRESSDHDTDSFEHIGHNDLTDDEADSLARDSPANELSELRTRSPLLLSDKPYDLAVSR